MKSIALVAVIHYALTRLCASLFGVDGVELAIEPMTAIALGSLALGGAQTGMSLFGGKRRGSNIDINAEMARINALYEQARTQGTAAITQDFQAQRGELAQSQAARGILRSGVSQLGLARLGAARQQALGDFNARLFAAQAGGQSSLLDALLGRKAKSDEAEYARRQAGIGQGLGMMSGALGAWGAQMGKPTQQGTNYFGTSMVNAPAATPQGFYQQEFLGGGYGAQGLRGGQMLGQFQAPSYPVIPGFGQ